MPEGFFFDIHELKKRETFHEFFYHKFLMMNQKSVGMKKKI